uniref:Protein SCO1/2 n=1 Tax=Candidatus Kentrum sp. FW TaxID=2126338 RepID=A0A450SF07_9GAMM|nr:MAG: protein SCO1/2 [Candidatus Kentron sp. FW]VFJ51351.1 MAG: protein SCO1/2 [Candidatus Kentron sp. FW]
MSKNEQLGYPTGNVSLSIIGVALLAIFSMLLWFGISQREKSVNLDATTTILDEPRPVPSFTLTDHHGNPFTNANLHGQWTFLYFGYTSCPDVCPTTLGTLTQADRILRESALATHPTFVFVSVDPERDVQEQLARYVSYFNPNFLGATGTPKEVSALARPLGIVYRRTVQGDSETNYLIDHTASVLLIDPKGRMVAVMPPPHHEKSIAENFRKIASEFEGILSAKQ